MEDIKRAVGCILAGAVAGLLILTPLLYLSEWQGLMSSHEKLVGSLFWGPFAGAWFAFMLVIVSLGMRDQNPQETLKRGNFKMETRQKPKEG